ncbi:hypothetical protein PO909_014609, partial [Leuciscus waleckii]
TAVERIVLEQLGELHLKLDNLTTIVQSLTQNRAVQQESHDDYQNVLPISTLEELNSFDEKLRQDADFKKHMIAKLSITGGNSIKKTVWRVCRKVFTPELATQLNWVGRGEKTGIKSRPVREILLCKFYSNNPIMGDFINIPVSYTIVLKSLHTTADVVHLIVFFPLNIFSCIVAVLRNGALAMVTEAEVETAIQNWLRLSQDRLRGQRRERPQL